MTRVMRMVFRATKPPVSRFRTLMSVVLISGTIAGLLLFAVQHFTTFPLIEKAETFENAAEPHHDEGSWHPSEGTERTLFTALTTVVSAIGFAGLLLGAAAIKPVALNWHKGALWGLAAFVCVDLAPAWGLPPQPPGVPVADLYERQLWWLATAILTAIGIWLVVDGRKSFWIRLGGLLVMLLPHIAGAPTATGENPVPAQLIHQFALLSILTTGMFWLALGAVGGLLYQRSGYADVSLREIKSRTAAVTKSG
jgi:cobalt transporter subunit CbtA